MVVHGHERFTDLEEKEGADNVSNGRFVSVMKYLD